MTRTETHLPSLDPTIAAHGATRVLLAALAALLRGRARPQLPPVPEHSAHLMRDLGLPPKLAPPPSPGARPW